MSMGIKRFWSTLLLIMLLILGVVVISGCVTNTTSCKGEGEKWTTFSNGCVDSCEYVRGEVQVCTQVLTEGCDCGPDKCWSGNECILNVKYCEKDEDCVTSCGEEVGKGSCYSKNLFDEDAKPYFHSPLDDTCCTCDYEECNSCICVNNECKTMVGECR